MFYRNHNDSKHNNVRIASLAAALALATAAVIGGNDLLKQDGTSKSPSAVTPRVERTAPQFSTAADAVIASQGIGAPSQFGTAADAVFAAESLQAPISPAVSDARDQALGLGQPSVGQSFATAADAVYAAQSLTAVGLAAVSSAAIDARDQALGIGQPSVGQSFATAADAVYAAQSTAAEQERASVAPTNLGDFLGLGQPGESISSEPQFGTMADADYASR